MGRVLVIVLDVPQSALHAWSVQRERSHRSPAANRLDAALVKALGDLPQAERVARRGSRGAVLQRSPAKVTSTRFEQTAKMAAAGLQVTLETSPRVRRVVACQQMDYAPGVTVREILYEVPLGAEAPVSSAFAAAPEKHRHVLTEAGDLAPLTTFVCERDSWRWPVADGIVVDIVFNRFHASTEGDAPPSRELHLTTPFVDDAPGASMVLRVTGWCSAWS